MIAKSPSLCMNFTIFLATINTLHNGGVNGCSETLLIDVGWVVQKLSFSALRNYAMIPNHCGYLSSF